jgi:hypothetical protein
VQVFVEAIVAFCAGSQLLTVADEAQLQQRQAQQADVASQRRLSVPTEGAACSQAAALLSEPKVGWTEMLMCSLPVHPAAAALQYSTVAVPLPPQGAATDAYQRFQVQGQSASVIATTGAYVPASGRRRACCCFARSPPAAAAAGPCGNALAAGQRSA